MTKPLKLRLPLSDFDSLHEVSDGRGQFCRAKKSELKNLLMDHSRVLRVLNDMGVATDEDYGNYDQVRKAG